MTSPGCGGQRLGLGFEVIVIVIPPLSVVLLEIDLVSVAALKFEREAPRAIDMHAVALGREPLQTMELIARQVDVLDAGGFVDHGQTNENTPVHSLVDSGFSGLPERRQAFVFEGLDHEESVAGQVRYVNKKVTSA